MSAPLRVLVLWFPDWPLRAALGDALPHPPTALMQANIVVACTASAREHGTSSATRLARRIPSAFPALLIRRASSGRRS